MNLINLKISKLFFAGVTIAVMCSCQSKLSISDMSSEELFQISMKHPSVAGIFAFNDPCSGGIGYFLERCPEFREFLSRDDFAAVLLNEYRKHDPLAFVDQGWTDMEIGKFSFHIRYIEFFLAQKFVINQLDNIDLWYLKEMAVSNYQKKKTLPEIYDGLGLCSTAALCTGIILNVNPDLLEDIRFICYQEYPELPEDANIRLKASQFVCTLRFEGSEICMDAIVDLLNTMEL